MIDERKESEAKQDKGETSAMKAYSVDVREKVLRAVDQGYPREQIVKLLGVSRATIKRYLKQRRETGTITPKAIPGRTPKKLGLLQAELVAQRHSHDDLSLEEQCRLWEQMKQMDAWRLVVVDECGSNIALMPLYARAPKGQRAYSSVPRNRGKNTIQLASLSLSGVGASLIIEGAVDALAFETYVEHILAPSLSAGQIVVLDNLSAHKGARVRQLIEACGCDLLFAALLLSRLFSHRRDFFQAESLPAAGGCQDACSAARSHSARFGDGDRTGCPRVVHPLRLPVRSSKRALMC